MAINCCKSYVGKQIIGLLPSQVDCLFYYSPNVPVGGYTIEGIPFNLDADINSVLNPLGIYYASYYDITDNNNFVITYVGSSQPTYVIQVEDSLGKPVTITWDSCCTKTCYEVTLNTDWTTDSCKYFWFGLNVLPFFPDGFPLNDQATWQAFLEFFYGPQVVVTNTVTPTTVYLKIDNAYICDIPIIETQVIPSTDMMPCGTPVPSNDCAYYALLNIPNFYQIDEIYLDSALNIQAFDALPSGYDGNGNLRNYMQSIGGDLYGINYVDNFTNQFLFQYYGPSLVSPIDIYDSGGNKIDSIIFTPINALGGTCRPDKCFTVTFDQNYTRLNFVQIDTLGFNIDYGYGLSSPYGDFNVLISSLEMTNLITQIFGNTATYDLVDNGNGTLTMTISNAIDYNISPVFGLFDGGSTIYPPFDPC